MKNLIIKFVMMIGITTLITSCEKSDQEHVDVAGTGSTTVELAKGSDALTSTGTTATSVVTLRSIIGEKLFPNKVVPKLTLYYLSNTQTSTTTVSSSVRTVLYTATNVSLAATPTPVAGAPVVTAIGAYGNPNNIVWGLTYTFNLNQISGILTVSNNVVSNSRGTSLILVAQDASNNIVAEYTVVLSEFGLRTL
jgi:hypothetical protein